MLRTFILIVFVVAVAGLAWFLVGMAPFLPPLFIAVIQWLIIVATAIWAAYEIYKLIKRAPA